MRFQGLCFEASGRMRRLALMSHQGMGNVQAAWVSRLVLLIEVKGFLEASPHLFGNIGCFWWAALAPCLCCVCFACISIFAQREVFGGLLWLPAVEILKNTAFARN